MGEPDSLVAELERRAVQQTEVAALGRRALTGADLPELYELAVAALRRGLETEFAAVFLPTPAGELIEPRVTIGWDLAWMRPLEVDGDTQIAHTLRVQEPAIVEDYAADGQFPGSRRLLEVGIRSGASVPIRSAEGRAVGVLATHSRVARRFSPDDILFLRAVANVLAASAARAAAEDARAAVEGRLRFLAEATGTLSGSLNYHRTLEDIAHLVVPRLADWCSVDIVEDGEYVNLAIVHADPEKARWAQALQAERTVQPDADHGVPKVVRTGRSEFYPEITDEFLQTVATSDEELERMRSIGMRSVLIVPLTARDQTLGALSLVWAESGGRYTEDDLAFAEELARRAALAVDNARLHDAAVAAAERLTRLQKVTEQLSEASTQVEVARVIVTAGATALGAQAGWVAQLSDDGDALEMVANFGYPEASAAQYAVLPMSHANPTTEAVRDACARWFRSGDDFRAAYPGIAANYTIYEAMAVMPLIDRGECIGALALNFSEIRTFTDQDRAALETLARQGAQALQRARLYDEREERAKAANALAHVVDGVFQLDDRDVVRLWNPAAVRITGVPESDALGRPISEVLSGWDAIGGPTGEAVIVPLEVGDRELWLSLTGAAYEDGTVYAFRDITGERRLEETRRDFVSTASHELRTPLAAVYGAAKTLLDRELSPHTRERLLEMIVSEGERLKRIVDDLLLANGLDVGSVDLQVEQTDAAAVASELVELAQQRAPEHIHVEFLPNGGSVGVLADPARLRQVLGNLLDNAIKYSPDGGRVSLAVDRDDLCVRFLVRDEGLGIPEAEQRHIFEKFYRLDPSLTRGVGGTGLGLYISRELVRQMNGRIWLESNAGAGSTFYVELPAHA